MDVENLRLVLNNFPSPNQQREFCKPGKKDQCVYFAANTANPCRLNGKVSRRPTGPANCEGILGVIKTYGQIFNGAPLRYVDPPFIDVTGTLRVLEIEAGSIKINPEIEGLDITPQYTDPVIEVFGAQVSFESQSRMLDSVHIEIPNVDVEVVMPKLGKPRFGRFDPRRYLPWSN